MESITAWLASITWPLVSRVLVAAGVGTVAYTGISEAVEGVFNLAKGAMSGMPQDVLFLLAKAGIFESMSITSGGVISGLAFMALNKFALRATGT